MLFHYKDNGIFVKHALTTDPDPQDFSFRSHYHNTYEIYYFLRGQGDLDTLERVFFRNKAHLNRRFKNVMGCSIWEYVIRKRIFSAQQELYFSKSVAAAFKASGFHDY